MCRAKNGRFNELMELKMKNMRNKLASDTSRLRKYIDRFKNDISIS